jgi:hypothetical protein
MIEALMIIVTFCKVSGDMMPSTQARIETRCLKKIQACYDKERNKDNTSERVAIEFCTSLHGNKRYE